MKPEKTKTARDAEMFEALIRDPETMAAFRTEAEGLLSEWTGSRS